MSVDPLLTPDDLRCRWKSSLSKIYLMSSAGELRKVKIGNLLRFRLSDIGAFEQEHTVNSRESSLALPTS